ncbi:thiamine pyrophosphate-dependent dehydrogenase E1 component subunit alpha [Clostridium sp. Mt-5]|uniref:Thiamine pyrophosphate-dependent dehydrogenase E1 component subunit alpha n=1 Tax=Clostridium moutaii TaxID=3240932 RepID=A0ABV4BK43_9CLOT
MLFDMYQKMLRIRKFEEKASECFKKGIVAGNLHLCVGQEAAIVGTCQALEKTDFITSTHRGHGHCIAKGAKTDRMMAEIFGKETGYCHGKGGSMHIVDTNLGILGSNGIVGAGIPIATGSALASKIRNTKEVTLAFFGDGASNQGTFHESINMAAAWKLPVIYLCENNQYAVSVNINTVTNTDNISVRAKAYNIPGTIVNGNHVLEVYEAVKKAVQYTREGNGPCIVECMTFRMRGHYEGDSANYRPKEITEEWKKKDPINAFKTYLLEKGVEEEQLLRMEKEMDDEIQKAYEFAQVSPYPDVNDVLKDNYSFDNERSVIR